MWIKCTKAPHITRPEIWMSKWIERVVKKMMEVNGIVNNSKSFKHEVEFVDNEL